MNKFRWRPGFSDLIIWTACHEKVIQGSPLAA